MTSDAKASETPIMDDVAARSMGRDIEPQDYYAALEAGRYLERAIAVATSRAAADAEDADCFKHLQNIPVTEAQAYFWNYGSRTERRKAIKSAIAARESSHGQG